MRDFLHKTVAGYDLTEDEAVALLDELATEGADPVLAGAVLTALRAKGESADEIRGVARRLRELAIDPDIESSVGAVDIVGTGGDASGSLNLSTGAALVAAAAGAPVIKHGNRSISSQSGSADVLEALGMSLPLDRVRAGELFEETRFTFLFAPAYHPAMRFVAPVRSSLAMRTIFNIAGPLANPASPEFAVIGAYSADMARTMAKTLAGMDVRRAFVVHGEPGWDEPTPVGPYLLIEVSENEATEHHEDPLDYGIPRARPRDLAGGDPGYNASRIRAVFDGEAGAHRDALILGASLALRLKGQGPTEAIEAARVAIDEGSAGRLLDRLDARAHV